MHDVSFFLFKNWLPVGVSAIVFFCVGLLLARFIWGSYSKRLANAVEENLNLASQWGALGVSQKDLFKKLRARWQADRDGWESAISAKDRQIAELSKQLAGIGESVPSLDVANDPAEMRIKELESMVGKQRSELETLRSMPIPAAIEEGKDKASDSLVQELQSRIRDLEQDLIDTHDELHKVRTGYEKQVLLVESLETKLIESHAASGQGEVAPESRLASEEGGSGASAAAEVAQVAALLAHRNREVRRYRAERRPDRTAELEEAREKLECLEDLQRRKTALQSELNDACHELYDVRKALNARLAEMKGLQGVSEELRTVEEEKGAFKRQLDEKTEELAATLRKLSLSDEQLRDSLEEMEDLRVAYRKAVQEGDAHLQDLVDTRHELSDVRLSYNEKVDDYRRSRAQMEELEAIIEDRAAEVNDLSTELRQQRDLVRQLKNGLAEARGELEALVEESRDLSASVGRKERLAEEQQERIASLELALSERYHDLNRARVEADERARDAQYFQAKTSHLEAEFDRRRSEFDASESRVAGVESALDDALAKLGELSGRLEESELSLEQLREELREVSLEKETKIGELDRAARRIEQLESAAGEREERLAALEREGKQHRDSSGELENRLQRLHTELEQARSEQEAARGAIAELEDVLRSGDERILKLSSQLEEKETEAVSLLAELAHVREQLDAREAGTVESEVKLAALRAELDARLEGNAAAAIGFTPVRLEKDARISELETEIGAQGAKFLEEARMRESSLAEIEKLHGKMEKRSEIIRDLQSRINAVMMQRSSRDREITLLKERLSALETDVAETGAMSHGIPLRDESTPEPASVDLEEFESVIRQALSDDPAEGSGIPLEALVNETASAEPEMPVSAVPVPVEQQNGSDEEHVIYFDEGGAVLNETDMAKIDECARLIRRFGRRAEVTVIGYAGSEGSSDFNESLSARRADAVRERLLERGVSQSLVSVRGAGQDRRFSGSKARRVEMVVAAVALAEAVN